MQRVRETFRKDETREGDRISRPRLRDTLRREDPEDATPLPPPAPSPTANTGARPKWQPEADTGTRSKGSGTGRAPLAVDQVGAAAVKLARGRRESVPRILASKAVIETAPLDARAAFVLSLVDGTATVDAIVDSAGMPAEEAKTILARLARLGLISA
jgi:hypothetical protein